MAQQWYAKIDGIERGPLTGQGLKRLATAGTLRPTDSIRLDGRGGWKPASAVKGLFPSDPHPGVAKAGAVIPTATRPGMPEKTIRTPAPESPSPPTSPLLAVKEHPALVALGTVCCFPAGLALVWTHRTWSVGTKLGWTAAVVLAFTVLVAAGSKDRNRSGRAAGQPRAESLDVATTRGSPGAWGVIDASGRAVVPFEYQMIDDAEEGLLRVRKGDKEGYIDSTGREVVPPQFDNVGQFSSGMASVRKGNVVGFVDKKGVVRVECQFESFSGFKGDFAWVRKGGESYFIDKSGNRVVPNDGRPRSDDVGGRWGLKGPDGKWIVNPQYGLILRAGPNRWIVVDEPEGKGKTGLIDDSGKEVLPMTDRVACLTPHKLGEPDTIEAAAVSDGSSLLSFLDTRTYRWGWLDQDGGTAIRAAYWNPLPSFRDGLAAVQTGTASWPGKYGFIDPKGQWVIEPQFGDARPFWDGFAAAEAWGRQKAGWGFIDRSGRFVIDPQFDEVGDFSDGMAWIKTNGAVGFINRQGQVVVPPVLAQAKRFASGVAAVQRR